MVTFIWFARLFIAFPTVSKPPMGAKTPAFLLCGCNSNADSNPKTAGAVLENTPPPILLLFLYGSNPTYKS